MPKSTKEYQLSRKSYFSREVCPKIVSYKVFDTLRIVLEFQLTNYFEISCEVPKITPSAILSISKIYFENNGFRSLAF